MRERTPFPTYPWSSLYFTELLVVVFGTCTKLLLMLFTLELCLHLVPLILRMVDLDLLPTMRQLLMERARSEHRSRMIASLLLRKEVLAVVVTFATIRRLWRPRSPNPQPPSRILEQANKPCPRWTGIPMAHMNWYKELQNRPTVYSCMYFSTFQLVYRKSQEYLFKILLFVDQCFSAV